jgi:hypothetical protein
LFTNKKLLKSFPNLFLEDGLLSGDPLLFLLPHSVEQAFPFLHQLVGLLQLVRECGALQHDVLHLLVARQAPPGSHVAVEIGHLLPDAVELAIQILERKHFFMNNSSTVEAA